MGECDGLVCVVVYKGVLCCVWGCGGDSVMVRVGIAYVVDEAAPVLVKVALYWAVSAVVCGRGEQHVVFAVRGGENHAGGGVRGYWRGACDGR